jgi:hypothetical protein
MAAPYNPPVKNEDFICYIALSDAADSKSFKANPTIAAGDFKVSKDGGALANLATLPTNEPASSIWVKITLSATEMNADNVAVQCIDQTATKEWADYAFSIPTTSA